MDLQIEKCITTNRKLPAPMVAKLLSYGHSLTFVLLDLKLLEEKMNRLGTEKTAASCLSGEELLRLSRFTSPKRKREWLGGRIAAKLAAARLLEQVESEDNSVDWYGHIIMVDKNGRPFLSVNNWNPASSVDISISHSGSVAAALAVDNGYCGVDIQKVSEQAIKVSERFCTHKEKKILQAFFPVGADNQAIPLTKLWAAKEALRKASLLDSLPGFLELELIEITEEPVYKKTDLRRFVFKWKKPAGSIHEICSVAVTHIENYALAFTVRHFTAD